MLRHSHLLPLAALLALSGCAGGASLGSGSNAVQVSQALPAPTVTTDTTDFSNYRMAPRDQVVVEVFGAPELKREGEVDAAGNLSMPLIGSVVAGGRTPAEVSTAIADKLRGRYLRNPQVTVNITKAVGQTVTVDGAVRDPGVYPVTGRMTLQQAIASAKGSSDLANLDNVVVFRRVNNQQMAALFSLKRIRAGQMPDPQIYGNDIVVVGENATRRFLRDVSSFPVGSFIPFIL
ncbi:polysaccharide export protein [Sphingomonas sp. BN140010]|uniref:Polysaccharide export protein n=1 Tax=Sphingomonas arvum TaxID=2992113 RepID=A0ABT3JBY2_9SPHN|nr:polysaccharide biosynthesis/export family protein [Sphingomonas sp. BN140010]MCW3796569.1 polysaccharide export protein [Sphingomonas sp. BN140010]